MQRSPPFRRAGLLLTRDAGVVITLADGAEFQISIVQSRIGDGEDEDDDNSDQGAS